MKKLFIFLFLMFSMLLSSCNSEDEENRVLSDIKKTIELAFNTPNSNDFVSLVEMEVKNQELFVYIKYANSGVSIPSIGEKLLFVFVPKEYINKSTNITYYVTKIN